MTPEFEAIYLRHVAASFEKQLALQDVITTRNWEFQMDAGQLVFAKKGLFNGPIVFAAQLLVSASEISNSWLWSWANEASQIPENLTRDAQILKSHHSIPEFSSPEFEINFDLSDEHTVALTVVGILGASAYYRGHYQGGAAFFILHDARIQVAAPDALRVTTFFSQFISSISVKDHRAAFIGYANHHHVEIGELDNGVELIFPKGHVKAKFDKLNRLADMETVASG